VYLKFDYDERKNVGLMSGDFFDQVRQAFSVYNEAHRFARYRGGFAPKRKYIITPTGRFDPCMYYEIRKYLKESQYNISVHKTDKFVDNIHPSYSITDIPALSLDLRDYQRDIVKVCLRMGRGVVVLATAGGKTLTIASLIESIYNRDKKLKCLVVVPDLMLVNQTTSDFNEYNVSFRHSKWTGSHNVNLDSNVIVANAGILQSDKSDLSWLRDIDLLIVDEVHKLRKNNKINKILKNIPTPNRFGFTGTLPEEQIDQWNIVGKIGPILFEKNSFQLRQEKHIANVKVQLLKIDYGEEKPPVTKRDSSDPGKKYRAELDFIINNKFRNDTITSLCNNVDNNTLVMVDYINHGEKLYHILTNRCPEKEVYFIRGDVAVQDRDKVKALMEKKKNIICIAISKIFSTGISIKNLHYIIFSSGGKAKIKIIQSIGRGLRLHKDKLNVIIIDIADQLFYGYKHMKKRLFHYKSENIKYGIKKITNNRN
jgi:superfamily II DNA or RNA helicase